MSDDEPSDNEHYCCSFNVTRDTPVIKSLRDAFGWPRHYWDAAATTTCVDQMASAFATIDISTAFSGVCAPSTALHCILEGLQPVKAKHISFTYRWAIEWSTEAQLELNVLPVKPDDLFSDILSFLTPKAAQELTSLGPEPQLVDMENIILRSKNAITIRMVGSRIHIAGTPCTDFSPQGKCEGLSGITMKYLLTWCRIMLELRIPIIVTENVKSFPWRQLHAYLPGYSAQTVVLRNTSFGHAVERCRRYTFFHLSCVVELSSPLPAMPPTFHRVRDPSHTWHDYMQAEPQELNSELIWASPSGSRPLTTADDNAFERCLIGRYEGKHLEAFKSNCPRGRVYTLSQNPDAGRATYSRQDVLHTIIANVQLNWSDAHNRWMTARELLSAQGFPVYQKLMDYVCGGRTCTTPLCSFNRSRLQVGLSSRERRHMSHQAGNSMMVSVVGAVMYWCCVYTVDVGSCKVPRSISSQALIDSVDSYSTPPKTKVKSHTSKVTSSSSSSTSSHLLQIVRGDESDHCDHLSMMRSRIRHRSQDAVGRWLECGGGSLSDPICSFGEWMIRLKYRRCN